MNLTRNPAKAIKTAAYISLLTAATWVLRGYVWPTLSSVEAPVLQALLDPDLFHNDLVVQESLRFTPRFYYNHLILGIAKLGLPLVWAVAICHLGMLAGFISGARRLMRLLGIGETVSAVFLVWLLTINTGTLGAVFFFTHAPLPGVWAASFVLWGAALAVEKRWTAAYWCFGCASLLQFLIGFYAGLLAFAPMIASTTTRKSMVSIAGWPLCLALVYIPMRLNETTSTGVLTGRAFVEIYAYLRHPHHLVPSAWPWQSWAQALVFYAGTGWYLCKKFKDHSRIFLILLSSTLLLLMGALMINYIFIEIDPTALIAKLQPARVTPLTQATILGLLALEMQKHISKFEYGEAAAIALAPLSSLTIPLLFISDLNRHGNSTQKNGSRLIQVAALLVLPAAAVALSGHILQYALAAALFALQVSSSRLINRPFLLGGAAAAASISAVAGALASLHPKWPAFLAARFAIDASPSDGPGILGRRFGSTAPNNAIVLIPPSGETWTFKLYSRRAVVVDDKDFPFTDQGMVEWKQRMDDVYGASVSPDFDLEKAWRMEKAERLSTVAHSYGADYLLTQDRWHPAVSGSRIDTEQGWSLWRLAQKGTKPTQAKNSEQETPLPTR